MNIDYKPLLPGKKMPVIIIGAGSIVRDAHLPAYRKAGFEVFGIVNRTREKAEMLAEEYKIPHVFSTIAEAMAAAPGKVVYDLALMPPQYLDILRELPDKSCVLIQKPMGDYLSQAREILNTCRSKKHIAAVNFQLRLAPFVNAARSIINQGLIGKLYDMEVRLTTYTPWEIFPHVAVHERLEILYHSIHYIDLIRSFLGNPGSVMSKTFRHPEKEFSSTRTTTLLDYSDMLRAVINTNHDHNFGPLHQESFIKWEGTKGAIRAKMGLLLDYPHGAPDKFEYCLLKQGKEPEWKTIPLEGSWFPDAFIGSMCSLMRYAEGSSNELPAGVEDVIHTMEVVESAYRSNSLGGIRIIDVVSKQDKFY